MKSVIKEFKNIFVQIFKMFRVKEGELLPASAALLLYVVLNALVIVRYADKFMVPQEKGYWSLFVNNFRVSGFDPLTYCAVSDWNPAYNIYRHPLLAFFVYPLSLINSGLMNLTGVNLVQYIVAAVLLFIVFYSYIFVVRICRELVGVTHFDAVLLSTLLFSFAYVMVSYIVPDHFAPSMFMLLMALYVCGVKMRNGKQLDIWQTTLMFFITAGITLSNGVKIFIDALFVDGKRFFRPRYILLAVIVPSALIWGFARWEYKFYKWPAAQKRQAMKKQASDKKRAKEYALFRDTTSIKDTMEQKRAFDHMMKQRIRARYIADHKQPGHSHKGKPIANGEFSSWTDISTPRWDSAVENLFGESIQLHTDWLLGDTLRGRPVLVYYNFWLAYIVEFLVVALFIAGIWCGRRSRFLWMMLSGFGFDLFIHVVLGFGLNEVYIMGAHWLFVIPISMAYLLKSVPKSKLFATRLTISMLATYLLAYNLILVVMYLFR